jgi:hypothetical protein
MRQKLVNMTFRNDFQLALQANGWTPYASAARTFRLSNHKTQARPGRTAQTFRPFLLTSRAPGITKNDSLSTAKDGGFSTNQWLCCSTLEATAHV